MKGSKSFRAYGPLFGILFFSSLLIGAEIRTSTEVLNLKSDIAEARAQTERITLRAQNFTELLGRMQEEMDHVKNLPITLAPNTENLAATVETCAVSTGISSAVSVSQQDSEKILIDVTVRGTQQELLRFLRELLSRPEMFFVERLECRKFLETQLNVQIRLSAFIKKETG